MTRTGYLGRVAKCRPRDVAKAHEVLIPQSQLPAPAASPFRRYLHLRVTGGAAFADPQLEDVPAGACYILHVHFRHQVRAPHPTALRIRPSGTRLRLNPHFAPHFSGFGRAPCPAPRSQSLTNPSCWNCSHPQTLRPSVPRPSCSGRRPLRSRSPASCPRPPRRGGARVRRCCQPRPRVNPPFSRSAAGNETAVLGRGISAGVYDVTLLSTAQIEWRPALTRCATTAGGLALPLTDPPCTSQP